MWVFESCSQRQSLQGWGLVLLSVSTLCLFHGGGGLEVRTTGGESGQNASGFSVPLVLLLTEIGVAQDGANEETPPAPTAEHEEDNTLGYTGLSVREESIRRLGDGCKSGQHLLPGLRRVV
ncbi:unnamed protein product [Pleuronectes platessa]|uniref:Uncharacterized protein n=1 Tax=Pleuronectes platessa TaxID=8262 RepID=A0A9N7YBR0_PLEPL|nr:unnamed protein product [Pleuronectes platessa]